MTQLHCNFQFASLQVSRANATVPLSIFATGFAVSPSSARPLSLSSLRHRPPTVCDGNFRGVLYPRVFFSVRTRIRGSNRAGRPLFKTLSKPADGTECSDEKAAPFLASNLRVSRWIGVRDSTFVYLNSKTGRLSSFVPRLVCSATRERSSSSLMPGVF